MAYEHRSRPAAAAALPATVLPATIRILPAIILLAMIVFPGLLAAQTTPPPGTSPQEAQRRLEAMGLGSQLRDQIMNSGLSEAEIRQQLASRGYDPSILDPYLDPDMGTPPAPGEDVLSALQALDIEFRPDTTRLGAPRPDTARERPREEMLLPDSSGFEREHDLRVFGLRTFARGTTEFEPMSMGPVPPGYLVGPGDELVLILTGDVESSYRLPVTREGFVVIPQVGQVWVNGLTMSELRDRLHTALGRAYSGIGRGPEATTHFEVTLGRLRSSQIFVTGEVEQPGSYITSPAASVLNALYQARGPRPNGSFRQVRVMRGGRTAAEVDLYDYLVRGSNVADVMLQPGDVIFVPIHGPQVAVKGEVGRTAIYEVRPGETLIDLLQFAGGLTAPAAVGRVRITRILPPMERIEPGIDRTVVEVDLASVIRGTVAAPELHDGDEIRVFRVRSELRGVVTVAGAVWKSCALPGAEQPRDARERLRNDEVRWNDDVRWDDEARWNDDARRDGEARRTGEARQAGEARRAGEVRRGDDARWGGAGADVRADTLADDRRPRQPEALCTFRLEPGMTAWDAIEAADGLRPDAYRDRAQIIRLDPSDSTLTIVPFSLATDAGGVPVDNPVLEEFDQVRVFSRAQFTDDLTIAISGEVRDSVLEVPYQEGMTLGDLILEAGGLTPEAALAIEVARRPDAAARAAGQITETVTVTVPPSHIISQDGLRFFREDRDEAVPDDDSVLDGPGDMLLRPYDRVFVRRLPNISDRRMVRLEGEVSYPGTYALQTMDERLSTLLARAGGLTHTAFTGGFRFYRDGQLVNVDLDEVRENPGSRHDVILLPGDSLVVPEYNPVVLVQGAVNSPSTVMYREGAPLSYYIESAGGFARHADSDAVYVRYANGQGAVKETFLLYTRAPSPGPGSTVTVPMVPETDRLRFMDLAGDIAQVLGTLATALVILTRL